MKNTTGNSCNSTLRKFLYVVNKNGNLKKIYQFRKAWQIDEEGFKSRKKHNVWLINSIKNPPVKLTEVSIFQMTTYYEFLGNDNNKSKTSNSFNSIKNKVSKSKLFKANLDKAISLLAKEIGLDNHWHYFFVMFLLFGKRSFTRVPFPGIRMTRTAKGYERNNPVEEEFILTITPNTSRREIINLWESFIEKEKTKMTGYIKIPPNKRVAAPK